MKYVAAASGKRRRLRRAFADFVASFSSRVTSVISSDKDYREMTRTQLKNGRRKQKSPAVAMRGFCHLSACCLAVYANRVLREDLVHNLLDILQECGPRRTHGDMRRAVAQGAGNLVPTDQR